MITTGTSKHITSPNISEIKQVCSASTIHIQDKHQISNRTTIDRNPNQGFTRLGHDNLHNSNLFNLFSLRSSTQILHVLTFAITLYQTLASPFYLLAVFPFSQCSYGTPRTIHEIISTLLLLDHTNFRLSDAITLYLQSSLSSYT